MVRYLIPILFLCSCSASSHIKKAVKKDPTILKEVTDTIKVVNITSDTIYNTDSTFYIKQRYDTIITYHTYQKYQFSEFKTWWEKKQEEKTKRLEIKEGAKTDRVKERQWNRTERSEKRNLRKEKKPVWPWVVLGAGLALILFIGGRLVIKKFFG